MPEMTMVQAIRSAMEHELERDPLVLVLGEDVGRNGGVFRATEGLQARFGPQRVVDTPLAELGIIGTAVGLAASGLAPVAEIQFLGFAYQAFAEIAGQVARFRMRSQGRFPLRVELRALSEADLPPAPEAREPAAGRRATRSAAPAARKRQSKRRTAAGPESRGRRASAPAAKGRRPRKPAARPAARSRGKARGR
ncbi:MAG: hypothetical protein K6T92_09395 [Candidatus Rokubacteria bacterium]|nr:hypothetical protein [Candidatus Rokubacteria bacterium]